MLPIAMSLDIKCIYIIIMGSEDARNSNSERRKERIKRYDRSYLTINLAAIFRSKLSCT